MALALLITSNDRTEVFVNRTSKVGECTTDIRVHTPKPMLNIHAYIDTHT